MVKVMIVDDYELVREGIKRLIEFDGDICVADEACDGEECLGKIRSVKPDVVLLDINMPGKNGFEILKELRSRKNCPKILMLTVYSEVEYLIKAIDMGADGYVLKDADSRELIRAVHIINGGEKFIQPSLIPMLNSRLIARDIDKEKIDFLSKRELEVLKLASVGLLNKEIGEKLDISERTVKNHMANIFRKLDCSDRTQAAVFSIRNGLVKVNG